MPSPQPDAVQISTAMINWWRQIILESYSQGLDPDKSTVEGLPSPQRMLECIIESKESGTIPTHEHRISYYSLKRQYELALESGQVNGPIQKQVDSHVYY